MHGVVRFPHKMKHIQPVLNIHWLPKHLTSLPPCYVLNIPRPCFYVVTLQAILKRGVPMTLIKQHYRTYVLKNLIFQPHIHKMGTRALAVLYKTEDGLKNVLRVLETDDKSPWDTTTVTNGLFSVHDNTDKRKTPWSQFTTPQSTHFGSAALVTENGYRFHLKYPLTVLKYNKNTFQLVTSCGKAVTEIFKQKYALGHNATFYCKMLDDSWCPVQATLSVHF
jgi:hypothetical protein